MLLGLCIDAINTLGTVGVAQGKDVVSKVAELAKRNLKKMITCLQSVGKLLHMAVKSAGGLDRVRTRFPLILELIVVCRLYLWKL